MNISKLKIQLEKKFNLISFSDLSELSINPGAAYSFFKANSKFKFEPNERIVLYSSFSISDDFIEHLYNATKLVNIGNCFVLICTSHNITQKIFDLSPKFDTNNAFQVLTVPGLTETNRLEKNFRLPDTVCPIPWNSLEIRPDGSISPCCVSNLVLGNIQEISLNDAFTSVKNNEFRQRLLAGDKPSACNKCWINEDQGLTSIRQHNYKRLSDTFLTSTINKPTIKNLDIKFQNTCNFKCIICSPEFSSLHALEQFKHIGIPLKPQSDWSESSSFLNQVIEFLPDLNNIEMVGGEPFLIKKFAEVLKIAVDQGFAKNIRLHYNSNGSIWPEELIKYWPHFQEVDIHFSIDAIGNRFEYQRGGSWRDVENNILRIKNLKLPNLNISVMPSISIMNIYYIDEVYSWAKKNQFQIFLSHVIEPEALSLSNLTLDAKELITKKHKFSEWDEMQKILNAINSSAPADGNKFCKKINWFDNIRETDFSEIHPEIAQAMKYKKL